MFKNLQSKSQLIQLTKRIIPPLLPSFHKGQCGRIAIIGGCEDYTGAPYFSAHAAATLGCDLTHVICEKSAGTVIKSYSPDLMVHPYLHDSSKLTSKLDKMSSNHKSYLEENVMPKVTSLLDRIHVVVLGPGFGRDPLMMETLELIIKESKSRDLPIILDADALFLVASKPEIIKGYKKAILTPNVVEFKRICDSIGVDTKEEKDDGGVALCKKVSEILKVTIFRKGAKDIIVNGDNVLICDEVGSNKRVGGQGDSLTGLISTMLSWGMYTYKNQLWEEAKAEPRLTDEQVILLACYGGALLTKYSARKAFSKYGRSMQTSDLHKFIGESYTEVFDV
ncbi:hypothetical protein CANARDRAFT_7052 [[Candida] arabinofermentans NRRL YB-2248]|uniref:ATP-dependent (S)-NAD(P)H-hydrate dehydratase n=1 Tax=[Candida] arabinofermentans NRRL YB-2248 TaxID=983967 RepID=A0A1E4T1R3_9ASCO|nr:hypothetical protein CANARDRAFT_7052 [[Candida] arabinofermentans NRRL YB-2248]